MIYFDNAATTRVSQSAAAEALRVMTECYGNPSSVHDFGYDAEKLLKSSRKKLLSILGSTSRNDDLIFTSGGTEANNLAIFGALACRKHDGKNVFFSDAEHASVYKISRALSERGYNVRYIPTVGGKLDLDFCRKNFDSDTVLISCMYANNETGALFDISALDKIRREKCPSALLHSDCVQAFCKTAEPLYRIGADLITLSGHKIHAPKGVGALYIREGVRIEGQLYGGGQEKDIRPGTEALPSIAALAVAAQELSDAANLKKVSVLREYLLKQISERLPEVRAVLPESFTPYVTALILPDIKSEVMLRFLSSNDIYVSAGSACSSKHRENRVLAAYGLDSRSADCTVRVSFCEENNENEVDIFIDELQKGIASLASLR